LQNLTSHIPTVHENSTGEELHPGGKRKYQVLDKSFPVVNFATRQLHL